MNCQFCGKELMDNVTVCDGCGAAVATEPVAAEPVVTAAPVYVKPENVLTGIVGALIGAVLGGASIILLSQLGFIAAISGFILAVCTLKGYEMLGGKLSGLGIAVSILIMIAMVYVGDRVSWAIDIAEAFGAGFFEAFQSVHMLISSIGGEVESSYISSLVMQYLFVAIGAVPTIVSNRKNSRVRSMTYRLGSGG